APPTSGTAPPSLPDALPISLATAALALGGAVAVGLPAGAEPPGPEQVPVRDAEHLDRAPVAVVTEGGVYVGWRMLGLDPEEIVFNVFRDGVKVNDAAVAGSTNLLDPDGAAGSVYRVQA